MKNKVLTLKDRLNQFCQKAHTKVVTAISDTRGDLATNTIGAIIVGVVIVGLLIVAINGFFPTFFSDMFEKMKTTLNTNW